MSLSGAEPEEGSDGRVCQPRSGAAGDSHASCEEQRHSAFTPRISFSTETYHIRVGKGLSHAFISRGDGFQRPAERAEKTGGDS